MGENVQCPVCTLFLHAGMNLSDHLETHPKEQVIKALVQMTISGSGGSAASSALAASLSGGSTPKTDPDENPNPAPISSSISDSDATSNSATSGTSNYAASDTTQISSQSFANAFCGISAINKSSSSNASAATTTSALRSPVDATVNTNNKNLDDKREIKIDAGSGSDKVQGSVATVPPANGIAQVQLPSQFDDYAANRYHQMQQKQLTTSQLEQRHQQQQHQKNQLQKQKPHLDGASASGHIEIAQQRNILPPPPPPMVSMPLVVGQVPNKLLHQSHTNNLFASNVAAHRHLQMHPIPQPQQQLQHQYQQQQQAHNQQQQQQQQQQNLKIYYSNALPTPPPALQMFPFHHASTQLQHQKPPPAYGTAISQIRSQNNQNKNKHATADKNHIQQHQQLQQQPHQQQQHHQQLARQMQQRATMQPTQSQTSTNCTPSLQLHQQQQQHTLANMPTVSAKPTSGAKPNELLPPPPPRTPTTNMQQLHQPQLPHSVSHFGAPVKTMPAVQQRVPTDCSDTSATATSQTLPSSTPVTASVTATATTPAIATMTSSPGIRQISSPYNSLLMTAAQSPSSSSVLRYAESPVAHYLERDNGDFIVQETPKHIVECVEKDNGEFSVIERIYQSPLSVLHIHEDNEKEDDDDADDDDNSDIKDNDNNKVSTADDTTKANEVVPMDIESGENPSDEQLRKNTKSEVDTEAQENEAELSSNKSTASVDGKVQTKIFGSDRAEMTSTSCSSDRSTPLHCANTSSAQVDVSSEPSTSSNSSANINNESNVMPSCSTTNSNQTHSSAGSSRKRSSKNTITVLSDVQLNLDEYLDLVGNIIASSKITAKSNALPGTMPIPLLKVEKEEPPDDDYESQTPQQDQQKYAERKQEYFEIQKPLNDFQAPTVIEPPTIANKNETEKIVENNCSSNKVRINDSSDNVKTADNAVMPTTTSATGMPICASHVTSVIRMATTSQQQQTQKDLVLQPTAASDATEPQSQHMFDDKAALAAQPQVTSIIIQDLSRQHIIQLQDEHHANRNEQQSHHAMEDPNGLLQQQVDPPNSKAEGHSLLHTRVPTSTTLPVQKRGPKKLIIKPKATKTDANANLNSNNTNSHSHRNANVKDINSQIIIEEALCELPTTSTKAQMEMQERMRQSQQEKEQPTHHTIAQKLIKSEPSSSGYDSNTNRISINGNNLGHSILENHLTSNMDNNCGPIIQCKTEQVGSAQEAQTNFLQPFKEEDKDVSNSNDNAAATDDARVLLDFANSKKHEATHNVATNFLSATSIFSNSAGKVNEPKSATILPNTNTSSTESHAALRCEDEFIAHDDVQEVVISSSYSQSQSASDVPTSATSSTTTSHVRDLNVALQHQQQQQHHHHQQLQQQQQQQQQLQHNFTDYPFSFLYGHGGSVSGAPADTKGGNFSAIYQQAAQDATTAATLASGSNTIHTDDSTSSTQQQQAHTSHFGGVHGGSGEMGSTASHWYHHALATANADFEAALGVDCNAAVDGGDVGKYLDLDSCKREVLVGMPGAPSSTSSSFAAATESSLAGGCTADALNIRTDEKMPAKGEISGQESNCDIENSWSQPMYGEISARFFKTTFPGIFQHENGWNHDEYFTVQDLSASAAPTGAAPSNRSGKSFDFRLPLEATTSAAANATGSGNSNFQLFARHTDVLPSTSTANKKKRKRDTHVGGGGGSSGAGRVEKATVSRVQPTATITSQQLLFPQPQSSQQLQAHEQLQQSSQNAESATSSTAAAAGANGTPTLGADQRRPRKKVYQCTHCTAEFPKLKDRNSHMILQHNYVRQNRRLICVQRPDAAASAATPDALPSSSNAVAGGVDNVVVVNMAEGCSSSLVRSDSMEFLEDSKQDIVKIEVENAYQPLAAPAAVVATAASTSTAGSGESIDAKPELVDDKKSMALLPASSLNIGGGVGDIAGEVLDTKPLLQPLAMTTPATKLAALYRMLVSYNISTLKDSHNLSEMEQKLIEQSIFFCYVCRRNFSSVKLYDAHLNEHPAECFTCGKTFQRWKNFSLHLKRHLGWKEFGCNVCDKKFVVRSALVEHMRMHTGHTPLKCKVCGKYFKRYSNLTQHRKRHGKQIIRKKEYVCHCGEVLPSKARFLWHKETHDAKPKCCPYCCDRFVHANSLRRHIRLAHSDKFDYAEPMECPLCKQTFAKSSIKAHMATHSMDTQHDCAICNKSFSTKWNLKIHSWVHANRTSKPFKCEHCPKAFVREVDFKNHMNAHKQIKPYTCEYCGCKFIRKYNYMRHRREHHGNKKFTCDLCKKSFHRHYYLIEHRRIHTGERPFQCTICGKSSTTKTNHNKHLKIHHSRDPFTVEA